MGRYRTNLVLATGSARHGARPRTRPGSRPTRSARATRRPTCTARWRDAGEAVAGILASKTFDNGTACASEQAIVVDAGDRGHGAGRAREPRRLLPDDRRAGEARAPAVPGRRPGSPFNVESVGQFATTIAAMAGISVPAGTRALGRPAGRRRPRARALARAALPGAEVVRGRDRGAPRSRSRYDLLKYGGDGHTAAIHAEDESIVARYARVPRLPDQRERPDAVRLDGLHDRVRAELHARHGHDRRHDLVRQHRPAAPRQREARRRRPAQLA